MTKMIENLGNRMITLMRVVNIYGLSNNKLADELNGMTMALNAMEIEFEFDYNDDVTEYTAITIMGKRFEI